MSSKRDDDITTWVDAAGRVSLADLAERFGVSEMTIRRDLDALTAAGRLRRVRGGAVRLPSPGEEAQGSTAGLAASRGVAKDPDPVSPALDAVITTGRSAPITNRPSPAVERAPQPAPPVERPVDRLGDQPLPEPEGRLAGDPPLTTTGAPSSVDDWGRAAVLATAGLEPGGAVLLAAGPATLALARRLAQVAAVAPQNPTTVVVTSLEAALALAQAPGVRLVLLGGEVDARSGSSGSSGSSGPAELVGPAALAALEDLHLDLVLLSPAGLDARGAWAGSTGSAQLVAAALRVGAAGGGRAVAVVGASALGRPSLVRAAPLSALQQVVAVAADGEDPHRVTARLQAVVAAAPRSPDLVMA